MSIARDAHKGIPPRGARRGALLHMINNGSDEDLGEVMVDLDATSSGLVPGR